MNVICPFCDSTEVREIETNERFNVPFSGEVVITHSVHQCDGCGEEGNFSDSKDKALAKAIFDANAASAPKIIDDLNKQGITMTYLEKALRLPFRTTARWKKGKLSHSSLALLRLIKASPALLEMADDNFSRAAIAKYQISRTWEFFVSNTYNPKCSVEYDKKDLGINFTGQMQTIVRSNNLNLIQWENSI